MIVTHEINWRMFCIGYVLYKNLKCFEIYIGPVAVGIWWGVKK